MRYLDCFLGVPNTLLIFFDDSAFFGSDDAFVVCFFIVGLEVIKETMLQISRALGPQLFYLPIESLAKWLLDFDSLSNTLVSNILSIGVSHISSKNLMYAFEISLAHFTINCSIRSTSRSSNSR